MYYHFLILLIFLISSASLTYARHSQPPYSGNKIHIKSTRGTPPRFSVTPSPLIPNTQYPDPTRDASGNSTIIAPRFTPAPYANYSDPTTANTQESITKKRAERVGLLGAFPTLKQTTEQKKNRPSRVSMPEYVGGPEDELRSIRHTAREMLQRGEFENTVSSSAYHSSVEPSDSNLKNKQSDRQWLQSTTPTLQSPSEVAPWVYPGTEPGRVEPPQKMPSAPDAPLPPVFSGRTDVFRFQAKYFGHIGQDVRISNPSTSPITKPSLHTPNIPTQNSHTLPAYAPARILTYPAAVNHEPSGISDVIPEQPKVKIQPIKNLTVKNIPDTTIYAPHAGSAVSPQRASELHLNPARKHLHINSQQLPWYYIYVGTLSPNEYDLLAEGLQRHFNSFTLLDAALISSGITEDQDLIQCKKMYMQIQQAYLKELSVQDTELIRAEKLLNFMHKHVLTGGYQLEDTTLMNLFRHGRYNCVTATILYCCLARSANVKVTAVELPGHAMCRVQTQRGFIDVETTCSTWFNYLDDPETRARVIQDLVRQAQPNTTSVQIRPITDVELIAKVYYNRGVDFLAKNEYRSALRANALALLYDPTSETAHGNLLATMNNWAILFCQEKNFVSATELLRRGIQEEPQYATFKNNHVHVYHRWIESLYQNGRTEEALQLAVQASSEQPQEIHFMRLRQQLETAVRITRMPTNSVLR